MGYTPLVPQGFQQFLCIKLNQKHMEGIVIVKVSELNGLLNEIKAVKDETKTIKDDVKAMRESEEKLKAYSIQKAADLLSLHYTTVRKLILQKKLFAKYLDGDSGKCSVPAWAIKDYLEKSNS